MRGAFITVGAACLFVGALGACGEESTSGQPGGGAAPTTTSTTSSTEGGTGGSPTTTTTTTTTGSGGDAGSGGIFECDDDGPDEPDNDHPVTAVNLLVLSDDDPATTPSLHGTIAGPDDVDWYTYLGTDDNFAYVDPDQVFTEGAAYVRMCVFLWCVDASIWQSPGIGGDGSLGTHECPPGTEEETVDLSGVVHAGASLGVANGCCTTVGGTGMHFGEDLYTTYWPLDCSGVTTNDGMKVFLRFEAQAGTAQDICEDYAVSYHF